MKKQTKLSFHQIVIILIIIILTAGAGIKAYQKYMESKAEQELSVLLYQITYEIERNTEEVQALLDYKDQVSHLSHRNAAIYYGTLTKLYMLRADWDHALNYFVDTQLNGEIAGAYDAVAWLYANVAQVYIGYSNYDIAKRCVETALEYGEQQQMKPFFYEYCYVTLAEICSYLGDSSQAVEYCAQSLEWDSEDFPEYQSMELRRTLVLAKSAYDTGEYEESRNYLAAVNKYMEELPYMPMDAQWGSGIYYPWLERQAALAMYDRQYTQALTHMDEMMAAGLLYSQTDRLMNTLYDTITFLEKIEEETEEAEHIAAVEDYVKQLLKEYPRLFIEKNNNAGEHIYNANMVTAAVFIQNYKLETVYFRAAIGTILVVLIITSLVLVWRNSEKKSRIDGLTGAFNRKYFNEYHETMKKSGIPYGMIMYDIDFFKQVNDGFGHEAGDEVLKISAHLAMNLLDRNSKLFRFGGDEFCIISKHKSLEELAEMAENIRIGVENTKWQWDGLKATFSMGVAISEGPDSDVMANADAMLYKSKDRGRNCVSWN